MQKAQRNARETDEGSAGRQARLPAGGTVAEAATLPAAAHRAAHRAAHGPAHRVFHVAAWLGLGLGLGL